MPIVKNIPETYPKPCTVASHHIKHNKKRFQFPPSDFEIVLYLLCVLCETRSISHFRPCFPLILSHGVFPISPLKSFPFLVTPFLCQTASNPLLMPIVARSRRPRQQPTPASHQTIRKPTKPAPRVDCSDSRPRRSAIQRTQPTAKPQTFSAFSYSLYPMLPIRQKNPVFSC